MPTLLILLLFFSGTSAVDVSKMRTIQSKVRNAITKSNNRENQLSANTARLPRAFSDPSTERNNLSSTSHLEIFVRKRNSGHWIFFELLDIDPQLYEMYHTNLSRHRDDEDAYLNQVNQQVLALLLGGGMGGEQILSKRVKEKLTQFRKLKVKDFEYGYQFIGSESIVPLITKSRAMVEEESVKKLPPPKIDLESQLLDYDPVQCNSDAYRKWILQIQTDLAQHNSSRCLLSSDGSAAMEGADCLKACSSVCVHTGSPLNTPDFSLLITGVESIATTSFDAELIGGLAAAVVATEVRGQFSGLVEVLTDSKTLVRAVRTGPVGDLADRGGKSRRVVLELLHELLQDASSESLSWNWTQGHPERVTEDSSQ